MLKVDEQGLIAFTQEEDSDAEPEFARGKSGSTGSRKDAIDWLR